jgi:DNA-binding LacI/PurR family transcriptional regulator
LNATRPVNRASRAGPRTVYGERRARPRVTSSRRRRLSAGLLLDHLWEEELVMAASFPATSRILLARRSGDERLLSSAPDFAAGARLIIRHLAECGCQRIYLGAPFTGDQAVDAAGE